MNSMFVLMPADRVIRILYSPRAQEGQSLHNDRRSLLPAHGHKACELGTRAEIFGSPAGFPLTDFVREIFLFL